MYEKILHQDKILAILIRSSFSKPGVQFFTPDDFSQQLGYINHKAGHVIDAHTHNYTTHTVTTTQEVLLIRSGKVKVDLFDDECNYVDSRILAAGDVILLASGGHGFQVLEDAEMIEIKQGPYMGVESKTFIKDSMPVV